MEMKTEPSVVKRRKTLSDWL